MQILYPKYYYKYMESAMIQQTDKIYPVLEIKYTEYESPEWETLCKEGWRTYEVYVDETALMLFQKYLH